MTTAQRPGGLLRQPGFRRLFVAHSLSQAGTELSTIAIAFAVLETSGSASALGYVLAARAAPTVLLMLLGGVQADRGSRRGQMFASDLVCAASQIGIWLLLTRGAASLLAIAMSQALLGAAAAFFRPAAGGILPAVVAGDRLKEANALLGLASNVSGLAGPALAGLIVVAASPETAILVDALTFLGSAVLVLGLPVGGPGDPPGRDRPAMAAEMLREGWLEVVRRRWLWAGIGQATLFQVGFAAFFALGPVVALETYAGAASWGLLVSCFGGGAAIGSVVAFKARAARPLLAVQQALVLTLPALAVLALEGPLVAVAVCTAIAGGAFAAADAWWTSVLQTAVPADRLSRVISFDDVGSAALRPLGYAFAGAGAVLVGVSGLLLSVAAILLLTIFLIAVSVRQTWADAHSMRSAP